MFSNPELWISTTIRNSTPVPREKTLICLVAVASREDEDEEPRKNLKKMVILSANVGVQPYVELPIEHPRRPYAPACMRFENSCWDCGREGVTRAR
jgi:hypothetical protein